MSKKRLLASFFLPLLLASFLQSQSLAELAKKEKERRAALKGKTTATVTSADVAKVKKRPAVETAQGQAVAEGEAEAQAQQEGAPPAAGQQAAEAPAPAAKPAEEAPAPDVPVPSEQDIQKKQNELAEIAQQKVEMVELLTLKLNSLYQEFHGLDNMKSRELVQIQISETYDRLLKAEAESAKAKKDLEDFLAQAKRASTPEIWIK
jgi:hypothetical protein